VRRVGLFILTGVLAAVLVLYAALWVQFYWGIRRDLLLAISSDVRGWVMIRYGEPTCEPLKERPWDIRWVPEGLFYRLRGVTLFRLEIPASMRACTSDPGQLADGYGVSRFEYVRPDGVRETLTESTNPGVFGAARSGRDAIDPVRACDRFFVGSRDAFEKEQARDPCVQAAIRP